MITECKIYFILFNRKKFNPKKKFEKTQQEKISQKDIYDWDLAAMKEYERSQTESNQPLTHGQEMIQRDKYLSDIFFKKKTDTDKIKGAPEIANKKSGVQYRFGSDIFNKKETVETPRKTIKQSHNQESHEEYQPPVNSIRKAGQNKVSEDNPFAFS